MTPKQIYGSNTLIFMLCIALTSCGSIKKYRKYNFFNGSAFYNDSLNISGRFIGDTKFYIPNKKKIKNDIKGLKEISYKDLFIYGRTFVSPIYDVLLFYKTNNHTNVHSKNKIHETLFLKDTINKIIVYKKSYNNKIFYLALKRVGTHKYHKSILSEAKTVINSMKFDNLATNKLTYMDIFNTYKKESNILYIIPVVHFK